MNQVITLFQCAVYFGTVVLFGALGEILCEKSGNLNLGVPGIMYLGGIGGLMGAFFYEYACSNAGVEPNGFLSVVITILLSCALATLGGLIYSFLTVTLRANQQVTGLTVTIFGSGFANLIGGTLNKLCGGAGQISVAFTSRLFRAYVPAFANNSAFCRLFLNYGWLVYVALVAAVCVGYFLNKTKAGLNLRAVGENPATADAAGINVIKNKYFATCVGACISGLGGLYYALDYTKGTWANDATIEALGWLAVALVIFSTWKPKNLIWGSYLFGVLNWLYLYIPGLNRSTKELFRMIPYVLTIIVLILVSLRKKKENQGPAALGLAYFREDR